MAGFLGGKSAAVTGMGDRRLYLAEGEGLGSTVTSSAEPQALGEAGAEVPHPRILPGTGLRALRSRSGFGCKSRVEVSISAKL